MKRPEGFDRVPPRLEPIPPPVEQPAEAGKPRSSNAGLGARVAAAREKLRRQDASASVPGESTPAHPASPTVDSTSTGTTRTGAGTAGTVATVTADKPREPAVLPQPDSSAPEARERARDARRSARSAASERRAVERQEVRRFTRRSRHRRAGWITAGAIVIVLVGAVTLSVFSPLLSLQTITVEGTDRVDKAAVLSSLHSEIGKPLATVDFGAVKTDLSNFPLIESYVTETRPPHTLVIRITERQPIASVAIGSSYELVDPAGVVIETSKSRPAGVPLVDIKGASVDGSVYRSTAEVLLALPAQLRKTVDTVTASTADDVTFTLTTGETVVWGGDQQSTQKAELLAGLIKDHAARDPQTSVEYDVSAPDNGIIRTK